MQYLKVEWKHENENYPILLYSELNCERMETRKIEKYSDGKTGIADGASSTGTTKLGIEPVPSIEEIAEDSQFVPVEISKDEFETEWNRVTNEMRDSSTIDTGD